MLTNQDLLERYKPPSFPMGFIETALPELRAALSEFVGHPCSSQVLFKMSLRAAEAIQIKNPSPVHHSILNLLVGRREESEFTHEDVGYLSVRLTGQILSIRNGHAAVRWSPSLPMSWSVMSLVDLRHAVRSIKGNDTSGILLKAYGLAGSLSGETIDWFVSTRAIAVLARTVGFSRFQRGKFPKIDDRELIQLRVALLVEGKYEKPRVVASGCFASLVEFNRAILRKRKRISFQCPFRYTHECHRCPVGAELCPAAVRIRSLSLRICSNCRSESYHQTEGWSTGMCLQCSTTYYRSIDKARRQ